MTSYNLTKIDKKLRKELDSDRYRHTLGVMYTSAALAMRYGSDLNHAQAAGLLHDCAKCIPDSKKIKLCEKNKIPVTEVEAENPFLLHSKVGAYIAKTKYDIDDEDILDAIRSHTTGKLGMTKLEQIVFIADFIEPRRDKSRRLSEIRPAAFSDLDECCYMILDDMLNYLGSKKGRIDPNSQNAYLYYKELHDAKVNT